MHEELHIGWGAGDCCGLDHDSHRPPRIAGFGDGNGGLERTDTAAGDDYRSVGHTPHPV